MKLSEWIEFLLTLRRYEVHSLNESDVSLRFVVFFTSLEKIWWQIYSSFSSPHFWIITEYETPFSTGSHEICSVFSLKYPSERIMVTWQWWFIPVFYIILFCIVNERCEMTCNIIPIHQLAMKLWQSWFMFKLNIKI